MDDIHRILVVDDDPVTLTLVRHVLEQAFFDVFTAASGEDALNLIKLKRIPHLAIVDINMPPGMDGFAFCQEAHKRVPGLPVIMLTSVGDEATIVKAFDQFQADDYVVKPKDGPIRADELVSRVRRVLRNQPDYSYTIESVATVDQRLQVDVGNRKAYIDGHEIPLTPTENKLLSILMRHPGRTLTNDYLLRQIWPMEYANEERLHTHVYRLRKKIEQDPKEPAYIVSDWGRGYIFPVFDEPGS
jgi:DNA-binding response OmpR family regulator